MKKNNQSGSIITFALIAIFLTGVLIAFVSQGAKKTASTSHLDELMLYMQVDIKTIQEAVSECVQAYPRMTDTDGNSADDNSNPNVPFPLYADLSSGAAGEAVADIKCPGAPTAQQVIFSGNSGSPFKALGDTSTYTTTYYTDATEGVYLRITRTSADALWTEAISRLNDKYSDCVASSLTDGGDCVNGCLYYWIVRRSPGGGLAPEVGCP